ncbi:MAG: hypothetical protein AB7P69_17415 [Candidatus Binatia bacterium]
MESQVVEHSGAGHEESTVELKPIILFAIILVVVSILSFAVVWVMLDFLRLNQTRTDTPLSALADPQALPPAPRLQVFPNRDLMQTRQTEGTILNAYRWVDKDAGIVGIPVERAIKILAERGLPARNGQQSK